MDLTRFMADLPYPTVEGTGRNVAEINLLMPVYGGRDSETTACLNYVYYSYVTKEKHPDLSECMEGIGIVEMKHHELLGVAIVKMGGTPYVGGRYNYWQGNYVNYAKDPALIIRNAIYGEKQAISDYRSVASKTGSPSIKNLVDRIIADEEIHLNILNELKEKYR